MSDEFEKMVKEMALENTIEKFDYFRKFKNRQEKKRVYCIMLRVDSQKF